MRQVLLENIDHTLFVLLLAARLADIGTTYLATPNLSLEANPVMQKLGWRFALITLVVCIIPYFSAEAGIMILVPSLMVSAANAGKIWAMRTMGEKDYKRMLLDLAARSTLRQAVTGVMASASFIILTGAVLLFFYPDPFGDYGFWFGMGIVAYGIVIAVHGRSWFIKIFKEAAAGEELR